ncbi:hypothetical protein RYA99_27700, partial [Pseudomonas syringae pv. actinidifoliorum]|nr:hypothetical protein [Pseudomonas syringae pv. actinidifoliorum]MDU8524362.1 hypothetical protein [Pseudomonas syringae pv. actinidifoliorum]MDU8529935.1 hypothetical protein [Pseudomonas syringae pv. actinidifoliorum]
MSSDPLCLVFIPALIAILTAAEKKKGMPLTEAEVCHIRDQATCIALPFSSAIAGVFQGSCRVSRLTMPLFSRPVALDP